MTKCGAGNGYAQIATVQYASNPHEGSGELKSPLLQFGATTVTKTAKVRLQVEVEVEGRTPMTSAVMKDSQSHKNITNYAYYIVLQYSTQQSFNLSIQAGPYSRTSNVTLPECSLYSALLGKYVSCGKCNISSYTDYNATFGCKDISQLCPLGKSRRRLDATSEYVYIGHRNMHSEQRESEEEEEEEGEEENGGGRYFGHANREEIGGGVGAEGGEVEREEGQGVYNVEIKDTSYGRHLSGTATVDDDYRASADDASTTADDEFSSSSQASTSEFGTILAAIGAELASVLSFNPFAADLSKAVPVLAFVGALALVMLIGSIYFLKWDKLDRHEAVYLLDEKRRHFTDSIQEDLRKGGSGVTFETLKEFRTDSIMKRNQSRINSAMITVSSWRENIREFRKRKKSINPPPERKSSEMTITTEESTTPENIDTYEQSTPHALIADFANQMLPRQYMTLETEDSEGKVTANNALAETIFTLQRTHWICHMFFGTSLAESRTLRFLECCRMVLLGLFIDTVIYGVFFPSDGSCAEFQTKATCLLLPSQVISGSTLCVWDKDSGCATRPRPDSITFTLLISFIIIMFVLPLDYFVGYIQEEYAGRRPRLEKLKLDTDSWLGSVYHKRETDKSPLITAFMHMKNGDNTLSSTEDSSADHSTGVDEVIVERGAEDVDITARKIFDNYLSPREELKGLIDRIQKSIIEGYCKESAVPWSKVCTSGDMTSDRIASQRATRTQLMINFDGTLKPLTIRQRIFFSSRQNLLEMKLKAAREGASKVCGTIEEMEVTTDHYKDIALMRCFMLEQISIFNRFSVKKCFNKIDGTTAESIHPFPWVIAWFIVIGCDLFFLYWIFAWGVKNGSETFNDWGKDYGCAVIQDVFVCETTKLCIIFVFAIMSAKPQLQVIKRVINDTALSLIQDREDSANNLNIVQHFSPACRAAHLAQLSELPSSAILR